MDWLQFISSIVAAIAWPAALVATVVLFWTPLHQLIPRIKDVDLWGGHATFAEELRKAQEVAEEISPKSQQFESTVKPDDPYLELAERYPAAAVMESFKEVLHVINGYRDKLEISPMRYTPNTAVTMLKEFDAIDDETIRLFKHVMNTRNAAVHVGRVTTGEAIEYRELCTRLVSELRRGFEKLRAGEGQQDSG